MVPDSVATVVVFGLLVAPGLTHGILADRRRPGVERTAFQEAARTVLASAVFTTAAGVLLAWPWVVVAQSERAAATVPWDVYLMVAATAATACGLALLVDWWRGRHSQRTLDELPTWYRVFRLTCPPGHVPVARVILTDGTWWQGRVAHYTAGDAGDDRELVLHGTLKRGDDAGADEVTLAGKWERVILRSNQIRAIQVGYPREPNGAGRG